MTESAALGTRIRGLRRREGLTQVQLAERLAVSPSYLNLIENNRRPLTAPLLLKIIEQIAQRMTTLRRPGAEGVPFHFLRIDIAGNISKRFTASGIRFARFAGACPRWNIHTAFLTPGRINVQLSRMSEGATYFCVARTVRHDAGGYHAQHTVQAIGLGCRIEHAKELVYADGIDLGSPKMTVPVGVTCRLCERMDCEQRVHPPMQHQLRVDENVRGVSFYAPATVAR